MDSHDFMKADVWLNLGFQFPITDKVMLAIEERNNQIRELVKLEKQLKDHYKNNSIFCDIYNLDSEPSREFYKISKERSLMIGRIMGLRKELRRIK